MVVLGLFIVVFPTFNWHSLDASAQEIIGILEKTKKLISPRRPTHSPWVKGLRWVKGFGNTFGHSVF